MNRTLTALVVSTIVAGCTHTTDLRRGHYFLVDESGKRHGPYHEFWHGQSVSVNGQTYTVFYPEVDKANSALGLRMRQIIIPELTFHQTPIQEVVAFLQNASAKFDTGRGKGRGVEFFLFLDPSSDMARDEVALLSFSEQNMSLYDATDVICRVLGLKWRIEDSAVRVEWGKEIGFELTTD